ncbi:MAG: RidA family protein [Anaerolineae bacterium]|nr:RidA family protein [Anaerolineae bacterium]
MKTFRNPGSIHPPVAAYTHQIEISGAERLLALSGQIGKTVDGYIPDDPIEQIEIAFKNLQGNLEAAGMTMADVVKITFYLVGEMDAARRKTVMNAWLKEPYLCTTLLFVSALANPQFKVEIDAWASKAL